MRADKFFAEKFGSRTKSAEAIENGLVLINGKRIKPKDEITGKEEISFVQSQESFVSNGGYKLSRALKSFGFSVQNMVFADIGASTGGFTDCLLQNGAKKVYAIDVGESLLHNSLQNNDKIVKMENVNARYLDASSFADIIDGVSIDVSFISLKLILPAIKEILSSNGVAFLLIKPQFECENKHIGKSGIVSPSAHASIVEKVMGYLTENGLYPHGIVNAPIRKGKNIEYVLYCKPSYLGAMSIAQITQEIKNFVKRNSLGELQ